jgi:hypothetical protein
MDNAVFTHTIPWGDGTCRSGIVGTCSLQCRSVEGPRCAPMYDPD